ncbi:MAG TPA: TIM-barrel domain-containing protein [Phycisphaerae bacterium]|nr:TIM-barrel domain-containing protein [Phycisphaerae bacterium]
MSNRLSKWVALSLVVAAAGFTRAATIPVINTTPEPDGLLLHMQPGLMRIQVWSDRTIRITYAPNAPIPDLKSYTVIAKPLHTAWTTRETPQTIFLETAALQVHVDRNSGAVGFFTLDGKPLLRETDDGRQVGEKSPAAPNTALSGPVRQSFVLPPNEGIYGLGQHQQGIWNYRGHTVHLLQENREVGIPVLLSSNGYLLMWDNPAVTDVSVGAPAVAKAPPPEGAGENIVRWSSEVGQAIDYYFCYGPKADDAIQQYRILSGPAPMMPKYLWGFWQSKERYRTQEEILDIAQKYRDLHIPIDGIVQDWRYWPDGKWGSHEFDKSRYPDPAAMVKQLHDMDIHLFISVWPKFDEGTTTLAELNKAGAAYSPAIQYVYPPGKGQWYDPFSDKGREIYWQQLSSKIFSAGIDGWWLDASEPELSGKWGEFRDFTTAAGPGANVFNAYPLMHTTAVYQGQRAVTSDKRVMILTRSAYAGQQRNAAITWSGDITGSWRTFRNQVPAGLNFSASGIPYWNTDTGAFFGSRDTGDASPSDPRYQELFARWFQFSSFCPMLRVHGSAPDGGTGPGKELWRFDEKTQNTCKTFLNLRYRLIPYIYSVSWQVTTNGSSMMRPLLMDFAGDPEALNIGDQYLFGPALMVNPVVTKGATTRSVYFPSDSADAAHDAGWYDFWTGAFQPSGKRIDAAAPVESMPLYLRAGSILPLGPLVQNVNEKPDAPIELRIYPGKDGAFTLFDDEGDSYRYEKGLYATIPITWDQSHKTLTIGERKGSFPGMIQNRTFNITFVRKGHGAGVDPSPTPDIMLQYNGNAVTAKAPD